MFNICELMKTVYVKVSGIGDVQYFTPEGYAAFKLTLSTGDYAVHLPTYVKHLPKGVYRAQNAFDVDPRLKYPTIESIIEAYNAEGTSADESNESEDCPLAEYISSFCYGKADASDVIKNADFMPETIEALQSFETIHGKKPLFDLLERHSQLRHMDIYCTSGELCSANIGETEHQPDDYLI